MVVGVLTIEIHIPGVSSLKGKRQVVQSVKKILQNRFNIAVAEVDYQDLWQRALLGVTSVASERTVLENELRLALAEVEKRDDLYVTNHTVEYI